MRRCRRPQAGLELREVLRIRPGGEPGERERDERDGVASGRGEWRALPSDHHQVDELVHRHRLERCLRRARDRGSPRCCLAGKRAREVGPELLDQQRHAFLAAAAVADRILDDDFLELACRR